MFASPPGRIVGLCVIVLALVGARLSVMCSEAAAQPLMAMHAIDAACDEPVPDKLGLGDCTLVCSATMPPENRTYSPTETAAHTTYRLADMGLAGLSLAPADPPPRLRLAKPFTDTQFWRLI